MVKWSYLPPHTVTIFVIVVRHLRSILKHSGAWCSRLAIISTDHWIARKYWSTFPSSLTSDYHQSYPLLLGVQVLLNSTYKWNIMLFAFLCLPYFSLHNIFQDRISYIYKMEVLLYITFSLLIHKSMTGYIDSLSGLLLKCFSDHLSTANFQILNLCTNSGIAGASGGSTFRYLSIIRDNPLYGIWLFTMVWSFVFLASVLMFHFPVIILFLCFCL